MTETYTAVLDRIVDGEVAVLLLEADGTVVDELALGIEELPDDGRHDGAVFDVELETDSRADDAGAVVDGAEDSDADKHEGAALDVDGDDLRDLRYRPSAERERRDATRERFERLSERLSEE